MSIKVVHCGTGNIGAVALRAILEHPTSSWSATSSARRRRPGETPASSSASHLRASTATNDWAELVDLGADCLTYFGNSIGRERTRSTTCCPSSKRGTNVVTFSGFAIAHPATAPAELRDPIEAACRAGQQLAATSPASTRGGRQRTWPSPRWLPPTASTASACSSWAGGATTPPSSSAASTSASARTAGLPAAPGHRRLHRADVGAHPAPARRGARRRDRGDSTSLYETDCLDHDVETGFGTVAGGHRVGGALRVPGAVRRAPVRRSSSTSTASPGTSAGSGSGPTARPTWRSGSRSRATRDSRSNCAWESVGKSCQRCPC